MKRIVRWILSISFIVFLFGCLGFAIGGIIGVWRQAPSSVLSGLGLLIALAGVLYGLKRLTEWAFNL